MFKFPMPPEFVIVGGGPVLHDVFGVGRGELLGSGEEALRLVQNLNLTNCMLQKVIADIRSDSGQ